MAMRKSLKSLPLAAAIMIASQSAMAMHSSTPMSDGWYLSGAGGLAFLQDSRNSGAFANNFVTGTGTTIPNNTPLPGAPFGWATEFDTGWTVSGAIGKNFFDHMRGELELAYQSNNVDRHFGVNAAGIPLDGEDAGVLIPGSAPLGASVGTIVNDGRGDVNTLFVMANAFYDFDMPSSRFGAYVGGGLGVGFVSIDFMPSGVQIIDDNETVFAYQIAAGVSYDLTPRTQVFTGYRYRGTTDVAVDVDLFPGRLEIENASHVVEFGVRFWL